jgi:hypothetical protein
MRSDQDPFPPLPSARNPEIEMPKKSLKGITRIEYEGVSTRGWMVRLTRQGKRQQMFFNDKAYGGKAKALKAAQTQYERWRSEAPPVATTKGVRTHRNSTGKVGVHVVRNRDERWKNAESFGYCASWVDGKGKRRKISFAWKRYGKKTAWNLASLAREHEIADRAQVVELYAKQSKKKGAH